MKQQLKYLKLFEGLTPDEIPYSRVHDDGDLSIEVPEDVKELPEIYNQLTDEVSWNLVIDNNKYLTSVTGFINLTKVGSYLSIENNKLLTSVTGFDRLTKIGTNLYIRNNPKLVSMSIPGNLVRSVNYSNNEIIFDNDLEFKSPPEFINSPVVIDDLVTKFNPAYHGDLVIKQIIDNLEEWGTEDTKNKVYSHLTSYLTPEQWELVPTHIQHLYHPDYKSTSGRDVAKLNTGQIYGIF